MGDKWVGQINEVALYTKNVKRRLKLCTITLISQIIPPNSVMFYLLEYVIVLESG